MGFGREAYLHLEFVGPSRVYPVAAVDLTGDEAEHDLAVRLRRIERELEDHDVIEEAVLTLATAEDPPSDLATGAHCPRH